MDSKPLLWFAAGAAASAAVTALLLYIRRPQAADAFSSSLPAPASTAPPPAVGLKDYLQDDVLSEQFTRNIQFFGTAGQDKIINAFVVVVGLGGVGSHAAHLLLRSGVGRLRLVDFDQVTVSSLNRHAVATREDVGTPKAACLEKHFMRILPEADIECINAMFTEDTAGQLLAGKPDFVLDAIDNIDTKVALLARCKQLGLPVLSVAGAGAKSDPTRLRLVDIAESSIDPLARAVRHKLRRGFQVDRGIPVLLSTEKPRCKLVELQEGQNPLDFQVVPNFRVRTIPVLGTAPAIFGMAAAGYILCQLAQQPFEPEPIIQLTGQQYSRALERLVAREEGRYGSAEGVAVDLEEVRYLLRDVWRGFSARSCGVPLPGGDKGLMRSTADLTFTRWDASRPATIDNLVLLTLEEAEQHDALGSLGELRLREPGFVAKVERVLDRVRRECWE